jgi:hypothetical protein
MQFAGMDVVTTLRAPTTECSTMVIPLRTVTPLPNGPYTNKTIVADRDPLHCAHHNIVVNNIPVTDDEQRRGVARINHDSSTSPPVGYAVAKAGACANPD